MTVSKCSNAMRAEIFEKAGFGAGKNATGVSVLLGFFKLLMTGTQVSSLLRQYDLLQTNTLSSSFLHPNISRLQLCRQVQFSTVAQATSPWLVGHAVLATHVLAACGHGLACKYVESHPSSNVTNVSLVSSEMWPSNSAV